MPSSQRLRPEGSRNVVITRSVEDSVSSELCVGARRSRPLGGNAKSAKRCLRGWLQSIPVSVAYGIVEKRASE
eukprot:7385429-Prymnesium_polylepis.2